jgi:Holliday junction DNA helicase RuvA
MIDSLIPTAIWLSEDGVRLRCGDAIFAVECSHRDAERLDGSAEAVLVILEVSEDALSLVGFSSESRRRLYRALRAVSGIGRRSALLVLDCGESLDTLRAVAGGDTAYFLDVPGLGKARIGAVMAELERRYKGALPSPLPIPVRAWVDARDALLHDGLSVDEAESRLRTTMDARAPSSSLASSEALLEAARGA